MFKKISLILFVLSAIVTADPVDLALVNENENDIEIAQDIEQALLNPNISNASEVEKAKLRDEFNKALCLKLKKNLDMTIHDKIEKRGLNRVQINRVLDVLAVYGQGRTAIGFFGDLLPLRQKNLLIFFN